MAAGGGAGVAAAPQADTNPNRHKVHKKARRFVYIFLLLLVCNNGGRRPALFGKIRPITRSPFAGTGFNFKYVVAWT